jgi:hypothetical protein
MAKYASVGAEAINGLMRGLMLRRQHDLDDEERKYREEQRNEQRQDRLDRQVEKQTLSEAGRPLEVNEGTDTTGQIPLMQAGQFSVGGQTTYDGAAAQKTAAEGNTPDGIGARQSAALRGLGKPLEAAQLDSANVQAKAAKFKLDRDQEDWLNEKLDKASSGMNADQFAGAISGTELVGGRQVSTVYSADGKKAQFVAAGPDGQQVKIGEEFDNTPQGLDKLRVKYSRSMTAAQKIAALQQFAQHEETVRSHQANEAHQGKVLDQNDRHHKDNKDLQRRQIDISSGHLGVAQQQFKLAKQKHDSDLKNNPQYALPMAVQLQLKSLGDQIEARSKAIATAQSNGTWDETSKGAKQAGTDLGALQKQYLELVQKHSPATPAAPGAAAGGIKDTWGIPVKGDQPAAPAAPAAQQSKAAPAAAPAAGAAARGIPAAAAPAAPAAPPVDPLLQALGATGNSSIAQITAQKAPAIREAAETVRAAQARVTQAAQAKDQQGVAQAMQQAQAAAQQLDVMLKDYMPQQAKAIRNAVGLY